MTKKDQMRYIELGNFTIDLHDGDVLSLDNVKDIAPMYPLKPMTTLVALCTKGYQKLIVNDQALDFGPHCVFVCPPNMHVSGLGHSDDFECKVLCVSNHLVGGLLRDKVDVWHRAVHLNRQHIFNISESCSDELGFYFSLIRSKLSRVKSTVPYEILTSLIRALLLELSFMMDNDDFVTRDHRLSQGKVLFNRFLSLISNSRIKRQPITVYAGELAITPKYLTMLCLKYSNKTASEWVAQYTVEEIRFFLKSTDLSIKEISARMGFSNMSHFGSYVRKHLGVSPSEYRYSKK